MRNKSDLDGCVPIVLGGIAALFCLFISLCSCRTQLVEVERPVVVEHTTTENRVELRVDTIFQRDSTIILYKGDTLVERYYNVEYRVRERLVADTVRDTVPIVTEVVRTEVREVAKPLPWWRSALQWLGGVALAVLCAVLGWSAWRLHK